MVLVSYFRNPQYISGGIVHFVGDKVKIYNLTSARDERHPKRVFLQLKVGDLEIWTVEKLPQKDSSL